MNAVIDIAASHQTRLGCSKIAQALDLSRWGTAYQLWEQYTGRAPWPNIGGELRVALGVPMEEVLRPFVEARLDRYLRRDRREYVHPTLPLVGHVDYRASLMPGEKTRPVVDMKTSLGFRARQRFGDGEDAVDPDVLMQMQGYMLLTGAGKAFVAALVPGPDILIYTLQADPELHQMMLTGIERFWWYVQNDVPPPVTTLADARLRWPIQTGATRLANAEDREAIAALRRMKAQIASIQVEADMLELAIKTAIGDAKALVDESDRPLATWHSQTRKTLDTTRLRQEQPEIAAQYSTETISRVFRLCKDQS